MDKAADNVCIRNPKGSYTFDKESPLENILMLLVNKYRGKYILINELNKHNNVGIFGVYNDIEMAFKVREDLEYTFPSIYKISIYYITRNDAILKTPKN